jgi:hypothetical protein
MTPLEMSKKAYDCFLTGDVAGLVALYSKDATFTPQMGLEGNAFGYTERDFQTH